jgi:hypothetical protein
MTQLDGRIPGALMTAAAWLCGCAADWLRALGNGKVHAALVQTKTQSAIALRSGVA